MTALFYYQKTVSAFALNLIIMCPLIMQPKNQNKEHKKVYFPTDKPHNPMVNAGAIVCTSLIKVSFFHLFFVSFSI